jgi:hypothetical protein
MHIVPLSMHESLAPALATNEVIKGPVGGYYIAAYACPSDSDREEFAPYFKLFATPPESYFEQAGCLMKFRPPIVTNDPARALHLAVLHAEEVIARMPSPAELQESRFDSLVAALHAGSARAHRTAARQG